MEKPNRDSWLIRRGFENIRKCFASLEVSALPGEPMHLEFAIPENMTLGGFRGFLRNAALGATRLLIDEIDLKIVECGILALDSTTIPFREVDAVIAKRKKAMEAWKESPAGLGRRDGDGEAGDLEPLHAEDSNLKEEIARLRSENEILQRVNTRKFTLSDKMVNDVLGDIEQGDD